MLIIFWVRTLRDGLGEAIADEEVMMCLLEEELRLYKEQTGDTAQERYNTLCDLLDICHEETPHTLRRATYLCEMAQVVCYQDFSQQTDWCVNKTIFVLKTFSVFLLFESEIKI